MKNWAFFFISFLNLYASTYAQWQWSSTISDSGNSTVAGIVVDDLDNVYITGHNKGRLIIGNDTMLANGYQDDIFFAKYNASGNLQWIRTAGGVAEDFGRGIALDGSGNVYVAGSFRGTVSFDGQALTSMGGEDVFLVKYDNNGNPIWAKSWGGAFFDVALGLVYSQNGNLFMTGCVMSGSGSSNHDTINFDNTPLISYGDGDVFIAKLDTAGNIIWAKNCGGKFGDYNRTLAIDENENSYITGSAGPNKAYFDDDSLINKGTFIAKYDSLGNLVWVRGIEKQTFGIYGTSIVVDQYGNVFAGGTSAPETAPKIFAPGVVVNESAYLAKYSSDGDLIWAKGIGNPLPAKIEGLTLDEEDNIYFTGYFNYLLYIGSDTINAYGQDDIFLNKYDNDGNRLWTVKAGGAGYDQGAAMVMDNQGNLVLGGYIASAPAYFGNVEANSQGMRDAFVAKFSPDIMGIEESGNEISGFSVYPNPSAGFITIRCDAQLFDNMSLVNIQGQTVFSGTIQGEESHFKLPELPSGVYNVVLQGKYNRTTQQLVLTKN